MKDKFDGVPERSRTFRNLVTRTLTGVIFVGTILGSMVLHPLAFAGVTFILMIIGLVEFYRLTDYHEIQPHRTLGFLISSVIFILTVMATLNLISPLFFAFVPFMMSLFFVAEMIRDRSNALLNIAFSILPISYITIPFATLGFMMSPAITGDANRWHLLFAYFIIIWTHDTFAYLTGLTFGRHKLWEKISPKKTWEGLIGGMLFGLAASYIISLFFKELNTAEWLFAALIIGVTGTFGDLSESLLKRRFHVKDSGTVFPGHGGVLDRFDAVLFSAPALLCYLLLIRL